MEIKDTVAVVTGGGSGLGLATARHLTGLGARVAVVDLPRPARLGRPEECARLVAHAIDVPMLNGEVIRLDAALRLAPR